MGQMRHEPDAQVGSTTADDGTECPTATVILSRVGNRRSAIYRSLSLCPYRHVIEGGGEAEEGVLVLGLEFRKRSTKKSRLMSEWAL